MKQGRQIEVLPAHVTIMRTNINSSSIFCLPDPIEFLEVRVVVCDACDVGGIARTVDDQRLEARATNGVWWQEWDPHMSELTVDDEILKTRACA